MDKALAGELKYSRTQARKIIDQGSVYINGKRMAVASRGIQSGDTITVYSLDEVELSPSIDLASRIQYEDETMIVVNKPAGLPATPTKTSRKHNLEYQVKDYLLSCGDTPVFLSAVNRLDAGTSGLMVFAKNPSFFHKLSVEFQTYKVEKQYLMLSLNKETGQTLRAEDLLINQGDKGVKIAREKDKSAKKAITLFRYVKSIGEFHLYLCKIQTGRRHQIRVQARAMGIPVLGDRQYGEGKKLSRMYLHAYSLRMIHPFSKDELKIIAPVDWNESQVGESAGQ